MNCHNIVDVQAHSGQLENAFQLFNELSEKLSASYRELETQVATLSGELAEARSERLKQLTEKEILATRLEGLLDALPGGVIVLDGSGTIMQANPVAHEMLGEQLCGQCWQQLAQRVFPMGGDELRLQDGRWVSLSVRRLEAQRGKILLLADISETRELQEKLNRKARLTSLGEMVASLAHQLRTPLAAALLYVSTLTHPRTRGGDIARISARARERLLHLERMVNDMLIFARGDIVGLEQIDVHGLADDLHAGLDELYAASGARLQVNDHTGQPARVCANRDTLLSVFQNLADNALEAIVAMSARMREQGMDYSGELVIDISLDGDEIMFAFQDNGTGIHGDLLDRVLEPFFTTRTDGIGLGLAVVNASIESFNGRLHLSSQPGAGSRFCVVLPRARQDGVLPGGPVNSNNYESEEVNL